MPATETSTSVVVKLGYVYPLGYLVECRGYSGKLSFISYFTILVKMDMFGLGIFYLFYRLQLQSKLAKPNYFNIMQFVVLYNKMYQTTVCVFF